MFKLTIQRKFIHWPTCVLGLEKLLQSFETLRNPFDGIMGINESNSILGQGTNGGSSCHLRVQELERRHPTIQLYSKVKLLNNVKAIQLELWKTYTATMKLHEKHIDWELFIH